MVATRQMMFRGCSWNSETVFDVEFVEYEIRDNYCQIQLCVERREDLFGSVKIDWGDGTVERVTKYRVYHNYTSVGRFTVRIGEECKWFRLWACYTVRKDGQYLYTCPQMWLRQWGDDLTSVQGTFCGWSQSDHGGLQGTLPPWGKSITNTFCCFEACTDIEGRFLPWTDIMTDVTGTYKWCKLTGPVPKWGKNVEKCGFCFYKCPNLTGTIPKWPARCTEFSSCYLECTGLVGQVPEWPSCGSELNGVYDGCTGITGIIPAWPENVTQVSYCYRNCIGLTDAWTHDPALLMPEEKVRYAPDVDYWRCYDVVAGCSDAVRALFWDVNWGGTIPRPAA